MKLVSYVISSFYLKEISGGFLNVKNGVKLGTVYYAASGKRLVQVHEFAYVLFIFFHFKQLPK